MSTENLRPGWVRTRLVLLPDRLQVPGYVVGGFLLNRVEYHTSNASVAVWCSEQRGRSPKYSICLSDRRAWINAHDDAEKAMIDAEAVARDAQVPPPADVFTCDALMTAFRKGYECGRVDGEEGKDRGEHWLGTVLASGFNFGQHT